MASADTAAGRGQTYSSDIDRGYPSLFGPDSEDEAEYSDDGGSGEQQAGPSFLPLSEAITTVPKSLASLLEVLLPRMQPRAEVRGVSLEDQQGIASVLIGELASQFSTIHHQVDDPFLNLQQNKALHIDIVVEVCAIIESLYSQYITKASKLSSEGVLSLAAQMSRLRAQLALQANKSLNVPVIRRRLLENIRGSFSRPSYLSSREVHSRETQRKGLNQLGLGEPLESKLAAFGVTLGSAAVRHRIGRLRMKIPRVTNTEEEKEDEEEEEEEEEEESVGSVTRESKKRLKLHRVSSMPEMWGNFLLCDLGLMTKSPHNPTQQYLQRSLRVVWNSSKIQALGIQRAPSVSHLAEAGGLTTSESSEERKAKLGDYTVRELGEDLKGLSTHRRSPVTSVPSSEGPQSTQEDLHPLLQAQVHGLSQRQMQRLAEYDLMVKREQALQEGVGREEALESEQSGFESIPSVPTMEQLPYLDIHRHASGSKSFVSADSMLVKSGASIADSTTNGHSHSSGSCTNSLIPMTESELGPLHGARDGPRYAAMLSGSAIGVSTELLGSRPELLPGSHVFMDESRVTGLDTLTSLTYPQQQSLISVATGAESLNTQKEEEEGGEGEFEGGRLQPSQLLEGHGSQGTSSHVLPHCSSVLDNTIASAFSFSSELEASESSESGAEEDEEDDEERFQPQPAVITTRIKGMEVVRTSDILVSERTPLNSLRLKPFGPVYNELTGELSVTALDELDSNLREGQEITSVYSEVMRNLPSRHLQFTSDPVLEPTVQDQVDLSHILASGTLHHRKSRRVVNSHLLQKSTPSWEPHASRQEWEKSNQYQGPDLKQLGINLESAATLSPEKSRMARTYITWRDWWRSTIRSEDYLKFVSREESDYLRLVYHLYDSDGSDSEEEQEEKERRERLAELHIRLKAKEAKRRKLYREKTNYKAGLWNVNAVMMGGLGADLEVSSDGEPTEEAKLGAETVKRQSTSFSEVQDRLQSIWSRLHFPERQRVDMAIKYSSHQLPPSKINKALGLWEYSCDVIEKREAVLSRLEALERQASDPSRFFVKGHRGSSARRLEEARKRDQLHRELNAVERKVSQVARKLVSLFGDVITYKGRPYHDKMVSDHTEMLYWLQQERRLAVLQPAVTALNSEVDLPPPPPPPGSISRLGTVAINHAT